MPKVSKPRRHGNRWRINYTDADGKRRFESYATYRTAQAALDKRRTEVAAIRAGDIPRPPEPRTFSELCDYWLEHRTSRKRSQKDDRSIIEAHLRPAFGPLQVTQVKLRRVDAFRQEREHLSPKTVHNHLTLLISMLNLAVELGWLTKAPRIKKPRLVDQEYAWLRTTEDITALLVAARVEPEGVMQLYAAAVYTGMRAGELLGLRWEDVDFDRRLITVQRSYAKPTKTGAIRHVPILDPLLPVLRAWKLACPSPELVFPNRQDRGIRRTKRPRGVNAGTRVYR